MIIQIIGWIALIISVINFAGSFVLTFYIDKNLEGARVAETHSALFLIVAAICFK